MKGRSQSVNEVAAFLLLTVAIVGILTFPGVASAGALDGGVDENDGYEPNDDFDTAVSITNGTYSDLRIEDGERDYFAVSLSEGESLNASIAFADSTGDLDMRLYGPDRNQLASSISFSDNESVSVADSQSGTYYVEVSGFAGVSAPYNLSVDVDSSGPDTEPPGDQSGVRKLSSTHVSPGEEITVTVEAVAEGESISISESISPAVEDSSVDAIRVNGGAATDTATSYSSATDRTSTVVTLSGVSAGDTVVVEYTVAVADSAGTGTTYSLSGTVTSDGSSPIGSDEFTVRGGSPLSGAASEYDEDEDGAITRGELGQAAADYAVDDLSRAELATVAATYATT